MFVIVVRELCKKHRTLLPRITETDMASQKAAGDSASLASPEVEIPVAYGRWGKPRCLADAKYDFLIIDATVLSTIDARDKVDLGTQCAVTASTDLYKKMIG